MGHPGAIAAALVGAFDNDALGDEPKCDRAASPGIDPVDDRHHRAAAESGRHLADNGIEPAASDRQRPGAGDDADGVTLRGIAAHFAGTIEPLSAALPPFGHGINGSPVSEAKNERAMVAPLSTDTE